MVSGVIVKWVERENVGLRKHIPVWTYSEWGTSGWWDHCVRERTKSEDRILEGNSTHREEEDNLEKCSVRERKSVTSCHRNQDIWELHEGGGVNCSKVWNRW